VPLWLVVNLVNSISSTSLFSIFILFRCVPILEVKLTFRGGTMYVPSPRVHALEKLVNNNQVMDLKKIK
jgi:hypothetical protein